MTQSTQQKSTNMGVGWVASRPSENECNIKPVTTKTLKTDVSDDIGL